MKKLIALILLLAVAGSTLLLACAPVNCTCGAVGCICTQPEQAVAAPTQDFGIIDIPETQIALTPGQIADTPIPTVVDAAITPYTTPEGVDPAPTTEGSGALVTLALENGELRIIAEEDTAEDTTPGEPIMDSRLVDEAVRLQNEGWPVNVIGTLQQDKTMVPTAIEIQSGATPDEKGLIIGSLAEKAKEIGLTTILEIGPGTHINNVVDGCTFAVERKNFQGIDSTLCSNSNPVLVYHTKFTDLPSELIRVDLVLEVAYFPNMAGSESSHDVLVHFDLAQKITDQYIAVGRSSSGFYESMDLVVSKLRASDGGPLTQEQGERTLLHYKDGPDGPIVCTRGLLQDVSALYSHIEVLKNIQSAFFTATNESNPLTLVCNT